MITIDQSVSEKLNQGMNAGGAVELPFLAPTLWVVNGEARLKQFGGASYYGGWATKTVEFEALMQSLNRTDPPHGFINTTLTTKDGKELDAYTTRSVIVAPVCYRRAWITKDGLRTNQFLQGARQHVQVVVYLATRNEKEIQPYGPVLLSAKGFQARNLLNAFGAWKKHSAALRNKVAPNIPSNLFYLAIGTYGSERKAQMVGQDGSQSSITPVVAWLPENMTEATLESLFVGNEVAIAMADMLDQAKEWRTAWDHPQADQMGANSAAKAQNYEGPSDGYQWPTEPPPGMNDDIPF